MYGNITLIGRNLQKVTTSSGRILYRHSSGMGTIMEFNDGQPRKVLVLDAKYRDGSKRLAAIDLSTAKKYGSTPKAYVTPPGDNITNVSSASNTSDIWINANIVKDSNTGKQNCDLLAPYINQYFSNRYVSYSGIEALKLCRDIKVDGIPCNIPNIQTLVRIYCDANAIDKLDPTISNGYSTKALGVVNTQGEWVIGVNTNSGNSNNLCYNYFTWSSTWGTSMGCHWYVVKGGFVNVYKGDLMNGSGFASFDGGCVIPILEIE